MEETLGPDQRWSTWLDVERGSRGPDPRPDWVVTEQAAIDTELGVLKTGKEAGEKLVDVLSMVDKLAKKGIIHKNKAANLKSKLTKKVNTLSAAK